VLIKNGIEKSEGVADEKVNFEFMMNGYPIFILKEDIFFIFLFFVKEKIDHTIQFRIIV